MLLVVENEEQSSTEQQRQKKRVGDGRSWQWQMFASDITCLVQADGSQVRPSDIAQGSDH